MAEDPLLEALWSKVLDDFDDDAAHLRFIEHCRSEGRLPEAARRYREHKERLGPSAPERAQVDKRLGAIALLAMAALDAHKSAKPGRHPLSLLVAAVVVAFFLAAVVGFVRALLS